LATQAARQLADRFQNTGFQSKSGGYYPDRPFREEILQEIKDANGATSAVITRNSYGCQVLNTVNVMFVDIDLPEPKPVGLFKRLFGKAEPVVNQPLIDALARVENWTRSNPQWGWRIYRTRAGLRLLATQALVAADSTAAISVFEALGADPLYQKLCKSQKCFRARLTPKPWRCGQRNKPPRWPWLSQREADEFKKWESHYQSLIPNFATCELIKQIGNPAIHPEVQIILKTHDEATRANSKLPLA